MSLCYVRRGEERRGGGWPVAQQPVTRGATNIMCEMSGWKSTSIDFLIIPAGYSTVSREIYCGCRKAMPGYDLHIYIYIPDQALTGSPALPDMFRRSTRWG